MVEVFILIVTLKFMKSPKRVNDNVLKHDTVARVPYALSNPGRYQTINL